MAGYLVSSVEIHDSEAFKPYVTDVPAIIDKYGGKFLVRGGALEVIEGAWPVPRMAIAEFPSVDEARRFLESPEYAQYKEIRRKAATTNAVLVQGMPSQRNERGK